MTEEKKIVEIKKEFEDKFGKRKVTTVDGIEVPVVNIYELPIIWDFFLPHITKTTPPPNEKVFAYDEPKYAGWYCQKCPTVVYKASEKDVSEHKCIKTTPSHDEIKREAVEGFVEFLSKQLLAVGGTWQDLELKQKTLDKINKSAQTYLTQQSLDKGDGE